MDAEKTILGDRHLDQQRPFCQQNMIFANYIISRNKKPNNFVEIIYFFPRIPRKLSQADLGASAKLGSVLAECTKNRMTHAAQGAFRPWVWAVFDPGQRIRAIPESGTLKSGTLLRMAGRR